MRALPSKKSYTPLLVTSVIFILYACTPPKSPTIPPSQIHTTKQSSESSSHILLDFEDPEPPVTWTDNIPPVTAPATLTETQPAIVSPHLIRSALKPNTGLWSLQADLTHTGNISHHFPNPADFQNSDTLFASVRHLNDPIRSGEFSASLFLIDTAGKKVLGDPFPITTQWQEIPFDLKTATDEGLNLSQITDVGIEFQKQSTTSSSPDPFLIQTDTWSIQRDFHAYVGTRLGPTKTFYVERQGTRLSLGMVGQYEITFFQRSLINYSSRPWMTITQGPRQNLLLGQPGTGLMLLDQNAFDPLYPYISQKQAPSSNPALDPHLPTLGWPLHGDNSSRWSWQCAWTSPVAAIVEVLHEVGPFDRLGQPAATLKWRFMIYQWGQVFTHVEWTKQDASLSQPITWALVLNHNDSPTTSTNIAATSPADAERLLSAIYPAVITQNLATALPHQLQQNQPIAMIAKTGATAGGKNGWWAADGTDRKIFGAAISQRNGPLDCMLLINAASPLMQAGSFSTYLIPPKIRLRQGELDRNVPGDADNDGLVEPYGFQVIRLAQGRTSFIIYPQERPLFYPSFLFTVPALERDAVDLLHSRMLINIDGKQFADPPQFPDGSFLLQMPYVIDRPVQVEGILVKK